MANEEAPLAPSIISQPPTLAPAVPASPAGSGVLGFVRSLYNQGKNRLGAVAPPQSVPVPEVAPPVVPAAPQVGLPSPTGRAPVFNPAGEQIVGVRTKQAEIDRQTEM